jgi:NSS family neurotransmitter:Na+ symporter
VHPLAFIEALKGKDILDTLDFVSNSILMPIGAIFTTALVICIIGIKNICNEIRNPEKPWYREYIYRFCMLVIVVPCLLIVLLNATGLLK